MGVSVAHLDAVIVGGGHNGLTAAAYLARAGLRVQLLERLPGVGGAAVSAQPFAGVDVHLSRYAYLVSLLPPSILTDLGARVALAPRRWSSYTPDPAAGGRTGLLIGSPPRDPALADFYRRCRLVTARLWPTLTEPLLTRAQIRRMVVRDGPEAAHAWASLVEEPIGSIIADSFGSDLVRGVVATDALIGTFAALDEPSLQQNRCFVYHLLGGGTGDWQVPVGGMGAVTGALTAAARRHGAEILTGADVCGIDPDGWVRYRRGGDERAVRGRFVLAGVTPTVLARLLSEPAPAATQGAQVKINMVLRRLPRLRDPAVSAEQAFSGTFHVNETWRQLHDAHAAATAGRLPAPLPCEMYCHSLTDPSIVSPALRAAGTHTLTVFSLHTPHALIAGSDPDAARDRLSRAVLSSIDSVLAEPIRELILVDGEGRPCIETTTTSDLQHTLGMTAGNIFHGGLDWPFAADDDLADPLDTPARRRGVATAHDRIVLCGSGARRGGAVSGIGGHNAAMAVLASLAGRS